MQQNTNTYFDTPLTFVEQFEKNEDGLLGFNTPQKLEISLRIGNAPIAKNLQKLLQLNGQALPPDLQVLFNTKDIYLVVHTIGVLRTSGHARIDQLEYTAEVDNLTGAQTLDLLPQTAFKDVLNIKLGMEGSVSGSGNFSASIPPELTQALSTSNLNLGGDMKIQLSTNNTFVGKFSYSLKFPLVQSRGISSTECSWVLNPADKPLLGDQLMIQTLAVPKGTTKVSYKAKGICRADRGIFWKQQVLETPEHIIEVALN